MSIIKRIEEKLQQRDYSNLEYYQYELCYHFSYRFDEWWDNINKKKVYLGKNYSLYCSHHFPKWWDKERYDYLRGSQALVLFCLDYFDMWWDMDLFDHTFLPLLYSRAFETQKKKLDLDLIIYKLKGEI